MYVNPAPFGSIYDRESLTRLWTCSHHRFLELLDLSDAELLSKVCTHALLYVICCYLTLSFASRPLQGITTKYRAAVQAMVNADGRRLIVNIDDVRQYNPEFAEGYVIASFLSACRVEGRICHARAGWRIAARLNDWCDERHLS